MIAWLLSLWLLIVLVIISCVLLVWFRRFVFACLWYLVIGGVGSLFGFDL